jgi:ribosomal protein S18 acetylase RimI-like enzyme
MGEHDLQVSLDTVRDKNVMQLKKLNCAIFPVTYQDKFYTDALTSRDFTKLAYYNDICVGSIACRLEKRDGGGVQLYIMTLGVLAPYRRLGIGTKLLRHVLDLCEQDQSILDVYLHVQINNNEAIEFYRKFGFDITDTIRNYYKRIDPPHCHVLSKHLVPAGKPK